ncbi:MAG: cupredoxin domain-containing protein [Acidimicrobiia bacterium]|nr:cupredoxin domain-containing protein [Acidimicrobiia bacterium]MDH3471797.1 cupredoxin domain-containing protein [Acidimicrobiia bacterium]
MKARKYLVLLMVMLVVGLAACSGGASTSIKVALNDFSMSPDSWEVPTGETITIEITNDGAVDHEWVLLQPGVTIASEADLPATEEELLADFVYWEEEVLAGETGTFTFVAPAVGTYQIICAIESHFDAGMKGELTVVAADS